MNADDWGRDPRTTDMILDCANLGAVSATAPWCSWRIPSVLRRSRSIADQSRPPPEPHRVVFSARAPRTPRGTPADAGPLPSAASIRAGECFIQDSRTRSIRSGDADRRARRSTGADPIGGSITTCTSAPMFFFAVCFRWEPRCAEASLSLRRKERLEPRLPPVCGRCPAAASSRHRLFLFARAARTGRPSGPRVHAGAFVCDRAGNAS